MGYEILLYVPNIIGYVRLLLLFGSLLLFDDPLKFLSLYITSVALDAADGIAARRLEQTSKFGAWMTLTQTAMFFPSLIIALVYVRNVFQFDVVIDLISRGALWCFISKWGYLVMMIEWLTFVCTHARGPDWKIPEENFPTVTRMVMANGFKTPVGAYAITGIFVLPLWLYGMQTTFLSTTVGLPFTLQLVLLVVLMVGRALGMTAELFYINQHIKGMLHENGTDKNT